MVYNKKNHNPRKVLIYRCGTLGDSIVSLPAIKLIKNKYPGAIYSLMTANHGNNKLWADTIYSEFNIFDHYITYKDTDYIYPWRLIKVMKNIRDFSPDLVLYMASEKNPYSKILRDKFFFRLSGAKNFYSFFNNYKKNFHTSDTAFHIYPKESVRFVSGLVGLGITELKIDFDLPVTEVIKSKIDKLFLNNGLKNNDTFIALCPWSKMQSKRWPVERYMEIVERIIVEYNYKIIIVGGREESDVFNPYINDKLKNNVFIFAGQLSILETAEAIRRTIMYLGNDTGPMHIASAVGIPSVALFSARAVPESWYPYGKNNIVIRKDVPCKFCGLETCIRNKIRCLTEISVDEVYEKCKALLSKNIKDS